MIRELWAVQLHVDTVDFKLIRKYDLEIIALDFAKLRKIKLTSVAV